MAKLWLIEYEVKCRFNHSTAFPLDMLRYDDSQPYSLDEWQFIINTHFNSIYPKAPLPLSKPIKLKHYSHGYKQWQPTYARWDSFGYVVINVEPPREIS